MNAYSRPTHRLNDTFFALVLAASAASSAYLGWSTVAADQTAAPWSASAVPLDAASTACNTRRPAVHLHEESAMHRQDPASALASAAARSQAS